jgi:anti-sigma factor RsiW
MNCNDIDKLLYDYITGRLNDEAHESVDAHLETCEVCRGNLTMMQEALPLVDHWTPPEVSPGFADRVLKTIQPQKKPLWQQIKDKICFPIPFKLPIPALAAAALVVLVVVVSKVTFTPNIQTIPRKIDIETHLIPAKFPIMVDIDNINAGFVKLKQLVQAHDGRIVRKQPVPEGMQVTLSVQGENEQGLLHDFSQLGKVSVEKGEYKDSEGNIVVILRKA